MLIRAFERKLPYTLLRSVIFSLEGMLPPFAIESEETRAMARHCTVGIEPRVSAERIILLDTQVSL